MLINYSVKVNKYKNILIMCNKVSLKRKMKFKMWGNNAKICKLLGKIV